MKKILISLTVFNKDIRKLPIFELVNSGSINEGIEILITDNSYKPSTIPNLIPNTHYKFSGYNAGTRQAILNTVSFLRERDQFKYVLFLDQDTQVDFLTDFLLEASQYYDTPMVFVPEVHDQNGDIVSPCAVNYFGGMRGCKDNYDTAILSGALIPTAFLCEIKHIPRIFWLDYLDHFLFFKYFPKPKLLSTIVEHNLSVSSRELVQKKRLMNIYLAELAFYRYNLPTKIHFGILKFIFNCGRLILGK